MPTEIACEDTGLCGSSKLRNNLLVSSFDKFLKLAFDKRKDLSLDLTIYFL